MSREKMTSPVYVETVKKLEAGFLPQSEGGDCGSRGFWSEKEGRGVRKGALCSEGAPALAGGGPSPPQSRLQVFVASSAFHTGSRLTLRSCQKRLRAAQSEPRSTDPGPEAPFHLL